MKKAALILVILFCVFTFAGCGVSSPEADDGDGRLRVVATIFPPYDFIREIAGDRVELTMLLPPGSEAHSFEPTPRDIAAIQSCDIFVYVGGESDSWIERILESSGDSGKKILPLIDMVEVFEEEIVEGMQEDSDHDEAGQIDEHVWTAPANAKLIVGELTEALAGLDAENASFYRANAEAYQEELDKLDRDFNEIVQNGSRKTIIFGDRFPFRYLAERYGLSYWAAFPGCSDENEAGASTITFLIDKVRAEEIPVIFYIEFSGGRIADVICESTGAKKLLLHSCHNLTKAEFESGVTYLELMRQNLTNLKEALG